jgi:glycosyltransferase involved in cell wall biosynthesis
LIYLNAEVASGLGEDTFWTWFQREFPSSVFAEPDHLADDDIVLRYSTLGFLPVAGKQLALCWELYPAMKDRFGGTLWDDRLAAVHETARYSTYRTVPSELTRPLYEQYGTVDVIPIGVDIDMFRPLGDKSAVRAKYGLPQDREIGIWAGTSHPMKGFVHLLEYARAHPDIHWITISKSEDEAVSVPGATALVQVAQPTLNELINAADFFLATNLLQPFAMVEWEAMACDVPMRLVGGEEREFEPSGHPREDVMRLGWDRPSAKRSWEQFLAARGVSW